MNKPNKPDYLAGLLALTLLSSTGCKTVVRENIISSVNTGIGVSLTENPNTELYEVKIGYIRTQFYSVPTGKVVEKGKGGAGGGADDAGAGALANDADKTPEVVSGIRMHSGVDNLLVGMDVSENFAVGKVAVMSPAAVAMYVADARSASAASAASLAAAEVATSSAKTVREAADTDVLAKMKPLRMAYVEFESKPEKRRIFDEAAAPQGYADFRQFLLGKPKYPTLEQIGNVRAELEKDAAIKAKLE